MASVGAIDSMFLLRVMPDTSDTTMSLWTRRTTREWARHDAVCGEKTPEVAQCTAEVW